MAPAQTRAQIDWEVAKERIREWLKELEGVPEWLVEDEVVEALKEWAKKRPVIIDEGWSDCYTYVLRYCRDDDCHDREYCIHLEIELPLHELHQAFRSAIALVTPTIAVTDSDSVRVRRYG